jgi:hypothetical protein
MRWASHSLLGMPAPSLHTQSLASIYCQRFKDSPLVILWYGFASTHAQPESTDKPFTDLARHERTMIHDPKRGRNLTLEEDGECSVEQPPPIQSGLRVTVQHYISTKRHCSVTHHTPHYCAQSLVTLISVATMASKHALDDSELLPISLASIRQIKKRKMDSWFPNTPWTTRSCNQSRIHQADQEAENGLP